MIDAVYRRMLLLLLWLGGQLVLSAPQEEPLRFRHLTIRDGLSQSAVYALCQDRQGFIWIGTKDGLNRYDGYRFTVYQHDPFDSTTISNNYITTIYEDRTGGLWVGTREGGLNRMDRNSERFERISLPSGDDAGSPGNRITAIAADSSGGLWVGSTAGLLHLPPAGLANPSDKFRFVDLGSPPGVSALLCDAGGNLWVASPSGLYRSARPIAGSPYMDFTRFSPASDQRDEPVSSLFQSSDGSIWAGTESGLSRFDAATDRFVAFPHHYQTYRRGWGRVLDIREAADGKLWLATPDELMIFDPADKQYRSVRHDPLQSASLSSNGLTRILRDRSGVLWLGTNGQGINLHDPKAERFNTFRRPPNFPSRIAGFSVRAILEDREGNLWISANVLYKWNRKGGKLTSFETDSEHPEDFGNTGVWSMFQDEAGTIWTGSYEGVYRYQPGKGVLLHLDTANGLPEKEIFSVRPGADGSIWIGSKNYLTQYRPESGKIRSYRYRQQPPSREPALSGMWVEADRCIWLASDDGLVRFDSRAESFQYFRNNPADSLSISNNVVLSILPDPDRPEAVLWLGTAGGGLNRLEVGTGRFRHFNEQDGLPNNVVYGVLADGLGRLWLSTNQGLARFDPHSREVRSFDASDGLQSNEFNTVSFYQSRSGEMFFGGINGLSYFRPERIIDNPHPPPVVITGLRLFNQPVTVRSHPELLPQVISRNETITLGYRDILFSFEFAALDYSAPSRNRYAYKLEGFNEEWIPAGADRRATFTNLPPGDYRFRVKGSNNDGVWNEAGASLRVRINPPPWRTGWAYGLYGLLLFGLLYAIRRYELNRILLKNRLQFEQVEREKLSELDQLKSRFFANISHEFRTPLTLILGQIDQVMQKEPGKVRLESARRNAQRLLRLINQLLDLSRMEAGEMKLHPIRANVLPFLRNIILSFESLAEQRRITLTINFPHKEIEIYYDPDKLEKVFINLLSNAFKFTPDGGTIRISSRITGNRDGRNRDEKPGVQISIIDSGPGIPPEQKSRIFDRFYQVMDTDGFVQESGSGIGLALARELVELHKGKISVENLSGMGAAFTVLLPLQMSSTDTTPKAIGNLLKSRILRNVPVSDLMPNRRRMVVAANPLQEPRFRLSTEAASEEQAETLPLLLIAEDHPEVRAFIREQLEGDYRVLEAEDGKTGLWLAREQIPDLIISDVMMPKMDGYQFCKALREDEKTSHIPMIMLTARTEPADKLAGLQVGVDDYLFKPFRAEELRVRVRNLIEMRRRLRERFRQVTVVRPAEVTAAPQEQAFLERVLAAAQEHLGEAGFDVSELAAAVGFSISQLNRKLRALLDQSAGQLLRSLRLQRAADLLKQNAGNVAEICYQVGFTDQANFTRAFKKQFGVAPGVFRKQEQ